MRACCRKRFDGAVRGLPALFVVAGKKAAWGGGGEKTEPAFGPEFKDQ